MFQDLGTFLLVMVLGAGTLAAMRWVVKHKISLRFGIAFLIALMLLPICAYANNFPPIVVFFTGAACFVLVIILLVVLASNLPRFRSLPVRVRLQFGIRDLFCLTTFLLGIVVFLGSGFQCSDAEEKSLPNPLPAALEQRYVWEMESGLVLMTLSGLVWVLMLHQKSRPTADTARAIETAEFAEADKAAELKST